MAQNPKQSAHMLMFLLSVMIQYGKSQVLRVFSPDISTKFRSRKNTKRKSPTAGDRTGPTAKLFRHFVASSVISVPRNLRNTADVVLLEISVFQDFYYQHDVFYGIMRIHCSNQYSFVAAHNSSVHHQVSLIGYISATAYFTLMK
jgi:hypothetical protein